MESLKRPPTRAEAYVAMFLSLISASLFGAVAYFLWFVVPKPNPISLAIFTTLSLGSVLLLYRAAFTTRRALSSRQFKGVSWFFTIGGAVGVTMALLFTSDFSRGSLLATSFGCLVLGLGALRQKGP